MERLTNSIDYCQLHCDFGKEKGCFFQDKSKCYEKNIYEKLREYENLEEQCLLLRLPVKVGDTIYYIEDNKVNKFVVYSFEIRHLQQFVYNYDGIRLNFKNFGKTVFITKAEAEQKLNGMESN